MAADHQEGTRSVVTLLVAAGGADKSPLRFATRFLRDYLSTN